MAKRCLFPFVAGGLRQIKSLIRDDKERGKYSGIIVRSVDLTMLYEEQVLWKQRKRETEAKGAAQGQRSMMALDSC